ncbi:N-terminal methionine N(alpha)-acetyltransferase NatE [Malassezia cuniculi]|uniref:Pre-mRNA-splicing factor CWC24 n=1 Tax=Malassezia cuniculi TaxID=948313 RepID=A0AAF0EY85_9BASI|nr:N-terminal methionine N(alpha)-acetyltransferase NatE [Malassezia cuniculi]
MSALFKKRAPRERIVRKREATDATDGPAVDVAPSAVVTKKSRTAESDSSATRTDRFGETTIHSEARAQAPVPDLEEEFARELETHATSKVSNDDGNYRGLSGYAKYTEERDDGLSSRARAKGPIKAPANVRTITVFDYQPDVCKDYKETGYCGFGDTCKFLHDRSDYLAGWQLQGSDEAADARAGGYGASIGDSDDEEDVPFACLLCRKPFTDPVVTLCGHYYCSSCAITRFAKTPKCFACGAKTGGIFNAATKIIARIQSRNEARATARSEARKQHGLDEDELLDGVIVESS